MIGKRNRDISCGEEQSRTHAKMIPANSRTFNIRASLMVPSRAGCEAGRFDGGSHGNLMNGSLFAEWEPRYRVCAGFEPARDQTPAHVLSPSPRRTPPAYSLSLYLLLTRHRSLSSAIAFAWIVQYVQPAVAGGRDNAQKEPCSLCTCSAAVCSLDCSSSVREK
jgi:hypothetical protein